MEPFRPWIDYCVYQMMDSEQVLEINQETKKKLLGLLSESVIWKDKTLPFMVASHHLTATLKRAYKDSKERMIFPHLVSRDQKLK